MYYSIATVSAFTIEVNASKFGPLIAELHISIYLYSVKCKNMTLYNKVCPYGYKILSIGNCHIFGTSSFIKTIIQFSATSY